MTVLKPGDRFYHYRVGRLLGAGFHGAVHEIVHEHTGAGFALKTMHLANVADTRMVRRALAEARGTYGIDHANVLRVFDLNCEANGMVWMRTELLEGEPLSELLGRLGRVSPAFALSVALEAAHGLHAAHEAQIIHRDVKPANLFYVTATRALKVIDFSIAKIFPEGLQTTVGRAGLGTPAFMAPEQLEGQPPTPIVDVYALGMTLWCMLAGRHPFQSDLQNSRELLRKQMTEMPARLADVAGLPSEVDRVVLRAVAKDPTQRYRSMTEMAQAVAELRTWLEHEAHARCVLLAAPPGEPPPPGDARTRRDYVRDVAARMGPSDDAPPVAPTERVIVRGHAPMPSGPRLGSTAPLAARPLPVGPGFGGTAPLGSGPLNTDPLPFMPARDTDVLPPAPVRASVEAPETPMNSARRAHVPAARPRIPWSVVALAMVVTGIASVAVLRLVPKRNASAKTSAAPPQGSAAPSADGSNADGSSADASSTPSGDATAAPSGDATAAPSGSPTAVPAPEPTAVPAPVTSSSTSSSPTSSAPKPLRRPTPAPIATPVAFPLPTAAVSPPPPRRRPGRLFDAEN